LPVVRNGARGEPHDEDAAGKHSRDTSHARDLSTRLATL
jgi:hypothetical protein